jgi:hypothetical protein
LPIPLRGPRFLRPDSPGIPRYHTTDFAKTTRFQATANTDNFGKEKARALTAVTA